MVIHRDDGRSWGWIMDRSGKVTVDHQYRSGDVHITKIDKDGDGEIDARAFDDEARKRFRASESGAEGPGGRGARPD